MNEKIRTRLTQMGIGNVSTLWDLLVWRVSADRWVIAHRTLNTSERGEPIDQAVARFERLLD